VLTTDSCKQLLLDHHINPASTIEYEINGEMHTFDLMWVITTFFEGGDQTKQMFVSGLEAVVKSGDKRNVERFFEEMGQLVLMASLSEKDIFKIRK
jgi:hypothetical protein